MQMPLIEEKLVHIPVGKVLLDGNLVIPENCTGIVLFAHGSGSSRHSPRNRFVAEVLNKSGIGTLLFDLLTENEDFDYAMRFDIQLLAMRLAAVTQWLKRDTALQLRPIGYFGASTGAAAALIAAAADEDVVAVVSRGGRPDLADSQSLNNLRAPTLLLVGERDLEVIELNRIAAAKMNDDKELVIVAGATHLFEEPGTLEVVAEEATKWFRKYFERHKISMKRNIEISAAPNMR